MKQSEKDKLQERYKYYDSCRREAETDHKVAYDNAKEAVRYYIGDQLDEDKKQEMIERGIAPVVVNLCKKPVDVVAGYFSQNMGDLGAFPVEGGDDIIASVLSEAMKWNVVQMGGKTSINSAVKSAAMTGIGWVSLRMNYDKDMLDGNVEFSHESQFTVLFDPAAKKIDLSDATYIIKRSFYPRDMLAAEYEDFTKEIEELPAGASSGGDSIMEDVRIQSPMKDSRYLQHDEMWYRDYQKNAIVVYEKLGPMGEPMEMEIEVADYKTKDNRKIARDGGKIVAVRTVPVIKRMIVIGSNLVVFDDTAPDTPNYIPLVPFFYDFTPEAEGWGGRYQGVVRSLIPHNDEINKRKSQMISVVLQQPLSGHYVDESSIVDIEDYSQRSGPGKIIRYRGQPPTPIKGDFSAMNALVELDRLSRGDIYEVGPNPDLLGTAGGSGPSAANVTIENRQRSALTSMQTAFDNFSASLRQIGRIMIDMMLQNWSLEKFDRIADSPVPPELESMRNNAVYDVIVDEKANNKTHQFAVFNELTSLMQLGLPIHPMVLMKYSGLDGAAKQQQLMYMQQVMQAQQQQGPPGQGQPPPGAGQPPPGAMPQG